MRDHASNVRFVPALGPAALSSDTTGAVLDRAGYESLTLGLSIGVGGITFDATNKVEFIWEHSDASGSGFAAVAQADVVGVTVADGGIVKSLVAAHAAAANYKAGYIGVKRYHRLRADFSGTHGTATPIAASWALAHAHVAPVAAQA